MSCRRLVFVVFLVSAAHLAAQTDNGLAAYKQANFKVAIPLLETAHTANPQAAAVEAALLSSLVSEDRLDRAAEIDQEAEAKFPTSPDVIVARGEFSFHMGNMPNAERLFKSGAQLQPENARAAFGLGRLDRAASYYRTGRLQILRAHSLDPDDALITQMFIRYLTPDRRRDTLPAFARDHPWLYPNFQEEEDSYAAVSGAIGEKKLFEMDGPPQETTVKFELILDGPTHPRGVALDLKIGDGHPVRMLFDTGASGILLRQSAIDKAGLTHMGSGQAWGIGDKGTRTSFAAMADTCQIGPLHFKNCLVNGLEGKQSLAMVDGLIGADFFQDYIVTLDFRLHQLHLKPLPPRPATPQGYDRIVLPEEASFTPVFRFGHMLMITTMVNRKNTGLFLLDTGSEVSNIDATFARLSTKLHGSDARIRGVSGNVERVYEAGKGELQFAHFRQDNIGLIAIDLNNGPRPPTVRMSGILGLMVLDMFRLTIDYRNGLVNFDYIAR